MKKIALSALLICGATSIFAMDHDGWATTYESLSAFQSDQTTNPYANRPDYVKPIVDNLGNVLNSNWYVSASVPKSPSFEVGLPLSIIPINSDDRTFSENGVDVPTVFGEGHNMALPDDGRIYGNKTLNNLGVFSYPYLQVGGSLFHARALVRGMWLPAISELRKFSLFGFGLQYSFGHFFQYMLPPAAQPLDISIVFGYSTSGIGYRPEDFEGELDLDISTTYFSFVIGYKPINFVEVMMSLGYQGAEMKSSGYIYQSNKSTGIEQKYNEIHPDITVKGNNGFRFSIAIALQLGALHPVVGFDYAGKSSLTTNVLYFKQQIGTDKTPDEIAKDKGYVRGAKQEEAPKAEPVNDAENESAETEAEATDSPAVEDNTANETAADAQETSATQQGTDFN